MRSHCPEHLHKPESSSAWQQRLQQQYLEAVNGRQQFPTGDRHSRVQHGCSMQAHTDCARQH